MIYDNIRTICEKKNISIKQVERELGFSNSSICKWNECEPSRNTDRQHSRTTGRDGKNPLSRRIDGGCRSAFWTGE